MDVSIQTLAIGILLFTTGFDSLLYLVNRIANKKINPSYWRVIFTLIEGYVVYGLITTASDSAVKNYVYYNGAGIVLIGIVSILAVILVSVNEDIMKK